MNFTNQADPGLSPMDQGGEFSAAAPNSLDVIQISRRLQSLSSSIESFLCSQMEKLMLALEQCQRTDDEFQEMRQVFSDLNLQRIAWERKKNSELNRLNLASEKLVEGWRQLENERRRWIEQRGETKVARKSPNDSQRDPETAEPSISFNNETSSSETMKQMEFLRQELEGHHRKRRNT